MTLTLTHSATVARLVELDASEELISSRRQALHRSIDVMYMSAPLNDRQITELDLLEDQERDISVQRRRLHTQIDKLRVEIGLPRSRDAQWVVAVS